MWTDDIARLDDIPEPGEEKAYRIVRGDGKGVYGFDLLDRHGFRITLPAFWPLIGRQWCPMSRPVHNPSDSWPRPVRRSVRFTKRDVMRAVEAIRAAGLAIASIRIEPDGAILVIPGKPEIVPSSNRNPWDDA
jgi:hypothetical protein